MRAALTIGGVAIGVFVVVAMGAVVNGIRASFQKDLESIGATANTDGSSASAAGGSQVLSAVCHSATVEVPSRAQARSRASAFVFPTT